MSPFLSIRDVCVLVSVMFVCAVTLMVCLVLLMCVRVADVCACSLGDFGTLASLMFFVRVVLWYACQGC